MTDSQLIFTQDLSISNPQTSKLCISSNVHTHRKKFNYENDVKINLDKEYTVRELLDMKDDKFAKIYELYEYKVGELMETMGTPFGGLIMPVFNSVVDTMERVVLERKILNIV